MKQNGRNKTWAHVRILSCGVTVKLSAKLHDVLKNMLTVADLEL
jgi:hypothetical protein